MARPSPQTERVVAIARLLAAHPDEGFTISELSRRLRLNKATFYPMLIALTDAGWLVRDPATKTYRLGPELIVIGEAAGRSLPAVQLARPAMVEVATELGVTCVAFTASGGVATLADQVWDVRSTMQPLRPGLWAPVKAPFGAVFVAWGDEDEVVDWLADVDPARRTTYVDTLRIARDRGYVVELRTRPRDSAPGEGTGRIDELLPTDLAGEHEFLLGEMRRDATYTPSTIEAPVLDATGRVVLALLVTGLPPSMTGAKIDAYAQRLLTATQSVSDALRK